MALTSRQRIIVALASVVGGVVVLGATTRGVGLSPDSLQYLTASTSAATGHGLRTIAWDGDTVPMTHFPPGYPFVLAGAVKAGLSAPDFARWLNIGLFGLTIAFAAIITQRMVPASTWAPAASACWCATAHDLVVAHSMAWSEPLYLTLTLGTLLALATGLHRSSQRFLLIAAVTAGLSALVRYVGIANVGVVVLATLLWTQGSTWRRLRTAFGVAAVAATPILIALLLSAGSSTDGATLANRRFLWHPLVASDARAAASVVSKWVTPLSDATPLTAVWFAVLAGLVAFIATKRTRKNTTVAGSAPRNPILIRVLLLYALAYSALLVLSMSFVDAQTAFEARIVLPLLLISIMVGVCWLADSPPQTGIVRFAIGATVALVLAANVLRLAPWFRDARRYGLALRRVDANTSQLVAAWRRLPATAQIYSNDPYFVRLHTGRQVAGLPRKRDPNSLLPNAHYDELLRALCSSAAERPTFLVLVDEPASTDTSADGDAAVRSGEVESLPGGSLVRVRPQCGA